MIRYEFPVFPLRSARRNCLRFLWQRIFPTIKPRPNRPRKACEAGQAGCGNRRPDRKLPAKSKKKAKPETGITAKPGFSSYFSSARRRRPASGHRSVSAPSRPFASKLSLRPQSLPPPLITSNTLKSSANPRRSRPSSTASLRRIPLAQHLRGDTVAISVPGQSGLARLSSCRPSKRTRFPTSSNLKPNNRSL